MCALTMWTQVTLLITDYRYQEPVVSLAMVGIKTFDSQNIIFLTAVNVGPQLLAKILMKWHT